MAEEIVHHVDDTGAGGSNLALGILLLFFVFVVLFLLFGRGFFGFNNGSSSGLQVPSRVDVNLNK